MKYRLIIDYLTGQDLDILVDKYTIAGFSIVIEDGNTTTIYPLFNVKTVKITPEVIQ